MEVAAESLELKIERTSRVRRVLGWLAVTITGLLSLGEPWFKNPGSRRFVVGDRETGEVVAAVNDSIGDDEASVLSRLRGDLEMMTRDEFLYVWSGAAR